MQIFSLFKELGWQRLTKEHDVRFYESVAFGTAWDLFCIHDLLHHVIGVLSLVLNFMGYF